MFNIIKIQLQKQPNENEYAEQQKFQNVNDECGGKKKKTNNRKQKTSILNEWVNIRFSLREFMNQKKM